MAATILVVLAVLAVAIFWQSWRRRNRRLLELSDQIPGPPTYPLVGNGLVFMAHPKDNQKIISDIFDKYGDYVRFWLGPQLNVGLKNPADIRAVLTGNKTNQRGPLYEFLEDFIGPGILSGGPTWRRHRKMVNPTYNKKAIQHFAQVFNKEAALLADELIRKTPGVAFDVYHDVVKRTTQAVCQTLMGLSKEDSLNVARLDEVVKLTPRMYKLIFHKMTRWWLQIPIIFWLSGKKNLQNFFVKTVDDMTSDIVEKRKKAMASGENVNEDVRGVVDRFMLSGELSEKEIKQETFTLFTTSQEASAKIASTVLLFLARLPDWQSKVHSEIVKVVGTQDFVSEEQLSRLPHLDMVFKEALRYLSIAAIIQRSVEEDVTVNDGKITIPIGSSILIPIQDLHRDPRYWEEPNKVMPERFLPENMLKRDPNAFIPFSLGPMDCIGRVFAINLIKTFVVHILRRVQLETDVVLEDLDIEYAISARFAAGYNLKVRPRELKNGLRRAE